MSLQINNVLVYRALYKTKNLMIALIPPDQPDDRLETVMNSGVLYKGEAYKIVGTDNEDVYRDAMACVLEDVAAAGGVAAADARYANKLRVRFSKDNEKELLVQVVYIHPKEQVLN
jgi:tRNA splicing ligase